MGKTIVVPLDGSELAESVLPIACNLAKNSDSEIVLLHVVEYPFYLFPESRVYPPLDPNEQVAIQAEKQRVFDGQRDRLEQIAARLQKTGYPTRVELREGAVVKAIVEASEKLDAHLIVLSTHGRTGNIHGMIGAVAGRLLREARTPVVLARPEQGVLLKDLAEMHRSVIAR